jgi:hypothetical protein
MSESKSRVKVARVAPRPKNQPNFCTGVTEAQFASVLRSLGYERQPSVQEVVTEATANVNIALDRHRKTVRCPRTAVRPPKAGVLAAEASPTIPVDQAPDPPLKVSSPVSDGDAEPAPTIDANPYTPFAERDPELAKTMQAAIERIAAQPIETLTVPEEAQPVGVAQREPDTAGSCAGPKPKVAAPGAAGIPLDVQFGQAGELAVESVLWLSRGILLGIGTLSGMALAAWALIEVARQLTAE